MPNNDNDAAQWHEIARESLKLAQGFQQQFGEKLDNLIAALNATCVALARVESDTHKPPCQHHIDLAQQQRQDAADLHEKINKHIQDGHAQNIHATVKNQREQGRDSMLRIELLIAGGGVIAAILIAVFK